jgi:DNA (cytosine-5)-methyltransferase 1
VRPLKGLSIFSGGGNLDRGLEEGGAVNFTHVIDISAEAIHTQRANAQHPSKTNFYWGSVDDYQLALCEGFEHEVVARIGDIQFIAAGSPCPGFSALQLDWKSEQSLRNASHITTLCSMLDVYRPEYALLENVVSMANTRNGHEEEKVFSQLIACIVGMGYQVSQFLMDSWTQGSAQRRSRIFLAIAAPGLRPISQPPQMFNHPDDIKGRSLGRLVNGLNFGSRDFEPAPFNYNTASAATADLPRIGSGMSQVCIPFPDHRVVYTMKESDRALMKRIPVYPPGQGYVEALKAGLLPPSVQKNKKEYGKAFRRIKAAGQFPTITTNVNAQDNRCGNVLHWADPRTMSIQEARRAQGFPDSEVIVGSLAEQWRIIGNAVDRHVSRALGWSLRMAVGMNDQRGDSAACDTQKTTERISSDWVPASDDELAMERITIKTTIERVRFAPRSPKPALHKRASTPKAHDLGQELSQAGESVSTTAVPRSVGKRKVPQALESVNSTTKRKVAQAPEQISNTSHVSGSTEKQRRKRVKTETDDFAESNSSQSHKRTRYSGHQIEFTPTRWSKIPEKEVRKVGKTESEQ